MKHRIAPYFNEIVSLTVMLLMFVALVGGQAKIADSEEEAASRGEYGIVLTNTDPR